MLYLLGKRTVECCQFSLVNATKNSLQEQEQETGCAFQREMNKTTESEVYFIAALVRKYLRI